MFCSFFSILGKIFNAIMVIFHQMRPKLAICWKNLLIGTPAAGLRVKIDGSEPCLSPSFSEVPSLFSSRRPRLPTHQSQTHGMLCQYKGPKWYFFFFRFPPWRSQKGNGGNGFGNGTLWDIMTSSVCVLCNTVLYLGCYIQTCTSQQQCCNNLGTTCYVHLFLAQFPNIRSENSVVYTNFLLLHNVCKKKNCIKWV